MTYFVQWLQNYGWHVYAARDPVKSRRLMITGFSGNVPLERVLTWCDSTSVTVLPTAA